MSEANAANEPSRDNGSCDLSRKLNCLNKRVDACHVRSGNKILELKPLVPWSRKSRA